MYLRYVLSVVTVAAAGNDEFCQMQVRDLAVEELEDAGTMMRFESVRREDLGLMVSNAHLHGATLNASVFADCPPSVSQTLAEPPKVYIPQPDFSDRVEMPREFVETYPQQYVGSVPVIENDIYFETIGMPNIFGELGPSAHDCSACGGATSCACVEFVVLPMDHHFVGGELSRTTRDPNAPTLHEHGELRWIATLEQEPETAMIPGASVMFAEKFMVYDYDGSLEETQEAQSIQSTELGISEDGEVLQSAREETEEDDDSVVLDRAGKVYEFYAGTRLGSLQNAAAYDPAALAELNAYLQMFPLATLTEMQQANDMKAHFQAAHDRVTRLPEGTNPASIVTSCFHLLEHPLLIRDEEKKKVKIALNMQLPWVRAQTTMSPRNEFSQAIGKGVFRTDAQRTTLSFHLGAMTYGFWTPERTGHGSWTASSIYGVPPQLYISAAGGVGKPSQMVQQTDLRAIEGYGLDPLPSFQNSSGIYTGAGMLMLHSLFVRYAAVPMSYAWLYKDQNKECNASTLHALESQVSTTDWNMLKADGIAAQDFMVFTGGLLPALKCGRSFLRGPFTNSNSVDALEVMAFTHWMMEWPASTRFHALRGSENVEEDMWDWQTNQEKALMNCR
jgi:hypothetical protein